MKKRVLIIGGGPAGLTAACELLKSNGDNYTVTVLEESDCLGGISRTVRTDGQRMDIGGHRFFSKDGRVNAWWEAMLPDQGAPAKDDRLLGRACALAEGGPDPEKEDRVMLRRNHVSRIYYRRHFFDYPLSISPQALANLGLFTTLRAGCSYLRCTLFKRPEKSLEDFYINRFGKVLYSMFFEGYTEKLWGRHPRDIAPDWGSQRVKGLSIGAILRDLFGRAFGKKKADNAVETSLIESFRYPKYGPGELWEAAGDEIRRRGGTILCGCRAVGVRTESSRVCGVTVEENGERREIECDELISSMPLKDLAAGMNDVPADAAAAAAGLPYRDFVTVGLLVDRLALKNTTHLSTVGNIVPDCWIYVQDTGVKLGRIQIFNNWSPYLVKDPEHTVWLGLEFFCSEGDEFWNMPEEACVEQAEAELRRIGVIDDGCRVLAHHREQVKKAYPAYFDTYKDIDVLRRYLNGFTNLYCIGRNGQHRYNNMDHSMETAFAAVNAIRSGSADKEPIWNVNADKDYQEEEKA